MKPDSIPELRGKRGRKFEAKIREPPTAHQKWVLKEASHVYKNVKRHK